MQTQFMMAALAGVILGLPAMAQQARAVVVTGQTLPGLGGEPLTELTTFRLNNAGQVAMTARADTVRGLWRFDPGGPVVKAAVSTDVAPGTSGELFGGAFADMSMNDLGQMSFNSFVPGLGQTVWISSPEGGFDGPAYSSNRTYLTSRLGNDGGLGVSTSESGVDRIQYIRQTSNGQAIGTAVSAESFADNGYAAYREVVSTVTTQEAIQRLQFGGSRATIVLGQVQNADGVTFGSMSQTTSVNSAGVVAFRSSFSTAGGDSGRGLWIGGTGFQLPRLLARDGDAVPGVPGAMLDSTPVIEAQLFDSCALLFSGRFDSPTGRDVGVFSADIDSGTFSTILASGTPAPGLAGETIDRIDEWYGNDLGSAVLAVDLAIDGQGTLRDAIVGYNGGTGERSVLFAAGDLLEVAPGDEREIAVLEIAGDFSNGNADRDVYLRTAVLNNSDQFLFHASFTDGTSGLFVAAVPAPASSMLLGVAGLAAMRRRR